MASAASALSIPCSISTATARQSSAESSLGSVVRSLRQCLSEKPLFRAIMRAAKASARWTGRPRFTCDDVVFFILQTGVSIVLIFRHFKNSTHAKTTGDTLTALGERLKRFLTGGEGTGLLLGATLRGISSRSSMTIAEKGKDALQARLGPRNGQLDVIGDFLGACDKSCLIGKDVSCLMGRDRPCLRLGRRLFIGGGLGGDCFMLTVNVPHLGGKGTERQLGGVANASGKEDGAITG